RNTVAHKVAGYRGVVMSLKAGLVDGKYVPAGDITEYQLDRLADLADQYSFGEIRGTHQQNLVFADVKQTDLYALWKELTELNLARPNIGTLTDMIVCPGFDLCALANATTYNIAEQIEKHFDDLDYLYDLGDSQDNMTGSRNACAHHQVGNIGIRGVDKKGEHWYQMSLGGSSKAETRLGNILGRSVATEEVAPTLEKILNAYTDQRHVEGDAPEPFADFVQRVGIKPVKEAVYG
ncbi:nitrite/sulfite reductase, partial [Leptospira borgpetersenii serovar Balcanica]|nr:nitrite/sulfite reductase [Leptospira borgpetersenii serovar Balcanica]